MKEIDKLMILLKNKAIYEMCLEDIYIWAEDNKKVTLYPSFVRFPEAFDFKLKNGVRSDKEKKRFEDIIKSINKAIRGIISSKGFKLEMYRKRYIYPSTKFLLERKIELENHIQKLREIRKLREKSQ